MGTDWPFLEIAQEELRPLADVGTTFDLNTQVEASCTWLTFAAMFASRCFTTFKAIGTFHGPPWHEPTAGRAGESLARTRTSTLSQVPTKTFRRIPQNCEAERQGAAKSGGFETSASAFLANFGSAA